MASITKQSSDALAKRLAAIPAEIIARVQPAVVKGAQEVAEDARTLAEASRDSGSLIESITVTPPGGTTPAHSADGGARTAGPLQALVTVGDSENRHSHLVEFGTEAHTNGGQFAGTQHPGTQAQPFMLPAWRLNKARVERRIATAIGKAIRESQK